MVAALARPAPSPATTPVEVFGAVQFDLTSKINGRTYRIFVFAPHAPPPAEGYPVIVASDGNLMFPIAATMGAASALGGSRAAVVVGVGYPTGAGDYLSPFLLRARDLSPPTPLSRIRQNPGMPPPKAEDYGGSDDFYRFLTEELRPAIAAGWSVNPNDQTLYGHSLGGLFTLGVLFKHPGSFRSFVASSPSIWWNRRAVLKDEAAFARKVEAGEAAPRVLIVVGGEEQALPDPLPPGLTRAQTRRLMLEARMVDNAAELAARLAAIKGGPGYTVRYNAFSEEDHMSVVPATLSRALAFALRR